VGRKPRDFRGDRVGLGAVKTLATSSALLALGLCGCAENNTHENEVEMTSSPHVEDQLTGFAEAELHAACAILEDFISREFETADRPLYLSDSSAAVSPPASRLSPTGQCVGVASLKSRFSYAPQSELEQPTDEDGPRYDSLSVSIPLVDLESGTASFNVARGCGPLCGGTARVTYRREGDAAWLMSDEEPTSVS